MAKATTKGGAKGAKGGKAAKTAAKKRKVNVDSVGEAHITASFNNIIISLTNKKGDVISWGSAKALNEDYIKFEKEVWKPIAMRSVMSSNQYGWYITEITQKNELLKKNQTVDFTHMYFNYYKGEPAPVNESEMMNQMDFKTQKLMELLNKSCERGPGFTASLVMTTW